VRTSVRLNEVDKDNWRLESRGHFRSALLAIEYLEAVNPELMLTVCRKGAFVCRGYPSELINVFLPEHLGLHGWVVMRDRRAEGQPNHTSNTHKTSK